MLQCVAVCCSVLQLFCTEFRALFDCTEFESIVFGVLKRGAVCCCCLQCAAAFLASNYMALIDCMKDGAIFLCRVLQCVAVCYSVLQCVAVCCSLLQCVTALLHRTRSSNKALRELLDNFLRSNKSKIHQSELSLIAQSSRVLSFLF